MQLGFRLPSSVRFIFSFLFALPLCILDFRLVSHYTLHLWDFGFPTSYFGWVQFEMFVGISRFTGFGLRLATHLSFGV